MANWWEGQNSDWWWNAYPGGPGGPSNQNQRVTNLENSGLGAPGYDISGINKQGYYNSPGPTLSAMSPATSAPLNDPYYGYGYLFGAPSGPLTPPGTPNPMGSLGTGNTQLAALSPQLGGGDVLQPTAMNPSNWKDTGGKWWPPGSTWPPAGSGAPPGSGGGTPTWDPGTGPAGAPLGPPTKQGKIVYSPVGDQEKLLDMLFKGSITGKGGGPIANMLYNLGLGQLPPALAEQIVGKTNEQFGKMGARFGTDLGTAQARGLAQASESQSLDAIKQILGLGGTTAGFQFSRGENALERAMKEFISQQQTDPLTSILQSLLQGGG